MKELTEATVRAAIVSCSGTMDGVAVKLGVTVTKLWLHLQPALLPQTARTPDG